MTDTNQIREIVNANIQQKIIEAFRDTPEMIDSLVKACLEQEVSEHGGKPDYHSQKMPYLTYLARSAVQSVAREAVQKYVTEMKDAIERQVRKSLSEADVVDSFTQNILRATNQDWKIEVKFTGE